jgi:hypothetical protein
MSKNIKDMKNKLRLILKHNASNVGDDGLKFVQPITPFIWGKPGIGKSQAVRQIADEYNIDFIDLRLSQLESADIRGIPVPDMEQGISKWLPPEFLPFEGIKKFEGTAGILLLDEFNRARPDVLQAAFQLVLDRMVGMQKILDSWFIVAAGNLGDEDRTDVVEMDSALKNRFIHFSVDVDLPSWIEWAEGTGVHSDVITFINGKPNWLYHVMKEEDNVFVTPRSWEKFSDILNQNSDVDPMLVTETIGADIINGAAAHFVKYLESKEIVSGKDIVTKYHTKSIQSKVKAMQRDQIYGLQSDIVDFILKQNFKTMKREISERYLDNLHEFCKNALEKDIYIAFMKTLAQKCTAEDNSFIDMYLQKYLKDSKEIIQIFKEKLS